MQEALFPQGSDHVYTVTELNREIKSLLEDNFSSIWLTGEISNFHSHSSGHFYFTLKDQNSQISAVMFRGFNRLLKFQLENGMEVIAHGHVSLYEPRGNYQIILEQIEPKGLGALQLAYEQLKNKLAEEGLFDEELKKPLPFLPKTVGIITSPTGAAIRDLIHVLHRRNPQTNILLRPAIVQGEVAGPDIAKAIQEINTHGEAEVLIIGRGGGSLEDLWAFNTEVVARAIRSSKIPVVSAVGHETDVTISDFVADLRAPTPSAAAELVVPVSTDLELKVRQRQLELEKNIQKILADRQNQLKYLTSHLKHPKRRLEEMALRLDELNSRVRLAMDHLLKDCRTGLNHLADKLEVLSPLSILSRGYSITHKLTSEGAIGPLLKKAKQVKKGDQLSVKLMEGTIKAEVK